MKLSRFPSVHRFLGLVLVCGFFLATFSKTNAQTDEQLNSARKVAAAWLAQIDSGYYGPSYDAACSAMQQKVGGKDKWSLVLQTIRAPWGGVVTRKEVGHTFRPDGVEGLPGECMFITYNTSFKKLDQGIEAVALQWDGDSWRPAGYNAMAKPADSNSSNGSQPPPPSVPPQPLPQ